MTTNIIHRVLYWTFHFVFSLFEYVFNIYQKLGLHLLSAYHEFARESYDGFCSYARIEKLEKKPCHLTVILAEEYSLKKLANFVVWCLGAKIPYLSIYDSKGVLQQYQTELEFEVNKQVNPIQTGARVLWHSSQQTPKNGFAGRNVHVKILTEEDGKQSVLELSRKLALTGSKSVTKEVLSEHLHKQYEFPDPDLGLVYGKGLTLHNYPPWQIRITEFIWLRGGITFKSFVECLLIFSKCEQRLGK